MELHGTCASFFGIQATSNVIKYLKVQNEDKLHLDLSNKFELGVSYYSIKHPTGLSNAKKVITKNHLSRDVHSLDDKIPTLTQEKQSQGYQKRLEIFAVKKGCFRVYPAYVSH